MDFLEIESKYNAKDIGLGEFQTQMLNFPYERTSELQVSGFDHYYVKGDDFIRYRACKDNPQLTMKRKIKDSNNYVRVEVNVELKATGSQSQQLETVEKFCSMLGFEHDFSIWKACFIHFFNGFNTVYYIVSDENMVEKARFIEIELDENTNWKSTGEAWTTLEEIERQLRSLGISPQNRLRKSLFETFRT